MFADVRVSVGCSSGRNQFCYGKLEWHKEFKLDLFSVEKTEEKKDVTEKKESEKDERHRSGRGECTAPGKGETCRNLNENVPFSCSVDSRWIRYDLV